MTPEIIAEYTAKISKGCSVIDGFCGSGGNVIQFSKYGSKVYAIDIDDNARLTVEYENGEKETLFSGEVSIKF